MSSTDVSIGALARSPVSRPQAAGPGPARPVDKGRPATAETEAQATAAPAKVEAEKRAQSSEELARDVEQLNELMQDVRRELQFSVDEDTGQTIIKVLDASTQEVVRQIPAEEVLALMSHLQQQGQSLMVDVEA